MGESETRERYKTRRRVWPFLDPPLYVISKQGAAVARAMRARVRAAANSCMSGTDNCVESERALKFSGGRVTEGVLCFYWRSGLCDVARGAG